MDNLLEIIIPLAIAAIYFFGNMFSKGADKGDVPPIGRPSGQDPDLAEQQRRIQESIRRKIMQRRQESEGGASGPTPPNLTRPQPVTAHQFPVESPMPPPMPPRMDTVAETSADRFSWDASDDVYETSLQEQLERIEATKREAENLQQQAQQARAKSRSEWGKSAERTSRRARSLTGSVRSSLRTPSAARAAFIYSEVLGRPVSLQKSSNVPGLESS
jgi:hypothetical protein